MKHSILSSYSGMAVIAVMLMMSVGCGHSSNTAQVDEAAVNTGDSPADSNTDMAVQKTQTDFDDRLKRVYAGDADVDGITDDEERRLKLQVDNPDSDGDGLLDGDEVQRTKTDPRKADTDGDGAKDGFEVLRGRDPLKKDVVQ